MNASLSTARRRLGGSWARIVLAAVVVLAASLVFDARATVKSAEKVFAEPDPDRALVYFIREHRFQGMGRTMFVYADETFLGTVDDDGYTFAYVEPGRRLLWLNWARVNRTFEFEPGRTYYFVVFDHFLDVTEEQGRNRIAALRHYCTPESKEVATSQQHLRDRQGKAGKFAKKETGEFVGAKSARNKHVAKWPVVDLTPYSTLVVEDFRVTDPKAEERKRIDLVRTAPARIADYVKVNVDPDLFAEIRRGALDTPTAGTLVLSVEITQYKPGSEAARMMMAGAGAARLDFTARLTDGATGREVARFADERSYSWGGAMGIAGGIETMERNLAHELSVYLRQGKGGVTAEKQASSR